MKVSFELEGTMKTGKKLKGIMTLRINPRLWLQWCREGREDQMPIECENKIKKQFNDYTIGDIKFHTKIGAYPECDYNKLSRLGLLGKINHVKCTTNPKGMFSKNYKQCNALTPEFLRGVTNGI